eukprot:2525218-Prymnesium_polylepis.1
MTTSATRSRSECGTLSQDDAEKQKCLRGSHVRRRTTAAKQTAHASLLSVERDRHSKRVPRGVVPYDADRLLS